MQESVSAKLGDWIGEGWRMFVAQWQAWVVNSLVVFVVASLPAFPIVVACWIVFVGAAVISAGQAPNPAGITAGIIAALVGVVIFVFLLALAAGSFFSAGLHRAALKQLRGEKVVVADVFSGGRYFLRVAGATLILAALSFIGLLMCILPAFLVSGLFYFTVFLIVDKDLGVIDAMRTSYDTCKKNVLWFALFGLILSVIAQAGYYALYVGLLVSYPLLFTIGGIAYRDVFDVPGMRRFDPAPAAPPASYQYPPTFISPQPGPQQPPGFEANLGFCASCKSPLTRGARFCSICGNPLSYPGSPKNG